MHEGGLAGHRGDGARAHRLMLDPPFNAGSLKPRNSAQARAIDSHESAVACPLREDGVKAPRQQLQEHRSNFLAGGGEMGARVREFDWSVTSLGPRERWPQSLRSAVSILLASRAQIVLFWGSELVALYNDAYAPVFGSKHPWALG